MKKFTIFTVILTVVVIVMMAELAVNQYLKDSSIVGSDSVISDFRLPDGLDSSNALTSNVLGADLNTEITGFNDNSYVDRNSSDFLPDSFESDSAIIADLTGEEVAIEDGESKYLQVPSAEDTNTTSSNEATVADFEDVEYSTKKISVFLREEHIRSAGFATGYIENQDHQGYLYKTIYIDDLYDVNIEKFAVRTDTAYLAKVYVFDVGINSDVNETYQLIRLRASASPDIEINETNTFGNASFFLNDSKRPETAFLTVRIGKYIYGFSYPKEYHAQIKNLVQLLVWDLG